MDSQFSNTPSALRMLLKIQKSRHDASVMDMQSLNILSAITTLPTFHFLIGLKSASSSHPSKVSSIDSIFETSQSHIGEMSFNDMHSLNNPVSLVTLDMSQSFMAEMSLSDSQPWNIS